jgi:hypothetical protein
MLLAAAAGAAGVALLFPRRDAPRPVSREPAITRHAPAVAPPQPANVPPPLAAPDRHPPPVAPPHLERVPPLQAAPVKDDPPWALLGTKRPGVPSAAAAPAANAVPAAVEQTQPRQEMAAPRARRAPAVAAGARRVEVKSIAYSPVAAQRTVTLRMEGASNMTLHEGEAVNGVEVQLILPDSVYLRRGGTVFAIGASR